MICLWANVLEYCNLLKVRDEIIYKQIYLTHWVLPIRVRVDVRVMAMKISRTGVSLSDAIWYHSQNTPSFFGRILVKHLLNLTGSVAWGLRDGHILVTKIFLNFHENKNWLNNLSYFHKGFFINKYRKYNSQVNYCVTHIFKQTSNSIL